MELLALDEAEACELLLALLLSAEPPLWLDGEGRNGQLRLEAIPEEATRTLDEVVPDPNRREDGPARPILGSDSLSCRPPGPRLGGRLVPGR